MYADSVRADAYDQLEFPGTYYLAFRDVPAILADYVRGNEALDFGCGAGRSTRFLRSFGYKVTGVDISEPMLQRARERDRCASQAVVKPDRIRSGHRIGKFDCATNRTSLVTRRANTLRVCAIRPDHGDSRQ